jgi:hypothetical protein
MCACAFKTHNSWKDFVVHLDRIGVSDWQQLGFPLGSGFPDKKGSPKN